MRSKSRGQRAVQWIETYCLYPNGPQRGQPVRLTPAQQDTVRQIYDGGAQVAVSGPLAAYLALLHTCGPEAVQDTDKIGTPVEVDIFTVWSATGPKPKEVLKRDGSHVVCPELGTRYPTAA